MAFIDGVSADMERFSDKMLALVAALFDARERGFYSEEEWRRWRKPAPLYPQTGTGPPA